MSREPASSALKSQPKPYGESLSLNCVSRYLLEVPQITLKVQLLFTAAVQRLCSHALWSRQDGNYVKLGFLELLAIPVYTMQQHYTDDKGFVSSGGDVQM
eukprot:1026-Heterococcus_DN1.PRE.4